MRSLLVRIFLSFWLIIGTTIGIAAVAGFYYSEGLREALENFDHGDTMLEASAALEQDGREGLVNWLRDFPKTRGINVFILDDQRRDLLDRPLPGNIVRLMIRHRHHLRPERGDRHEPRNLRRARPLSQLVSADGQVFTLIVLPTRHPPAYFGRTVHGSVLFIVALIMSGIVSYLLARAIANPIRKLRDATVSLADGNLDARVGASMSERHDELGMLARDFDSMANKLARAAAQQTELSQNISHELRSPLARMRVALELAKRQAGDLAEFERISDEAERLDNLIGQILSYTRMVWPMSLLADFQAGADAYYRKDFTTAYREFLPLAEQGVAEAQYSLGVMYADGRGVPENDTVAVKWYRLAAEQDYAEAQVNLGLMYVKGEGVRQDYSEAVRWFRKAAYQGHADAQVALGVMYHNGTGVPQNYPEAVHLYGLAAEQGNAVAQYNLGETFYNGMGVPQDYSEAVRWFRKAADQGDAAAQVALGVMYAQGLGVQQNNVEAMRLYGLAAEQGNAVARYNLVNEAESQRMAAARRLSTETDRLNSGTENQQIASLPRRTEEERELVRRIQKALTTFGSLLAYKANFNRNRRKALIF